MNAESRYPIHETFYSWQGEGCHLGRAAFFIRLFGCPLRCPWCDSAGTWHPAHKPAHVPRRTAADLAAEAAAERPEFVVITGGEPCIHDLEALTRELREVRGLRTHLETSGAFALTGDFDWVTLSPKRASPPLPECVARASEFKLVVDAPDALDHWLGELARLGRAGDDARPVWLHPEWSRRDAPAILGLITEAVKARRGPFRAGWQLHKLYRADALDPRARPDSALPA